MNGLRQAPATALAKMAKKTIMAKAAVAMKAKSKAMLSVNIANANKYEAWRRNTAARSSRSWLILALKMQVMAASSAAISGIGNGWLKKRKHSENTKSEEISANNKARKKLKVIKK